MENENWRASADNFINNEKEFHLGFLVTEASHPYTKYLDTVIKRNTADGVRQLLEVDNDIADVFQQYLGTPEAAFLGNSIATSILERKRIVFSGCGSTGRLAVLLESLWRKGCSEAAELIEKCGGSLSTSGLFRESASKVRGIITGGDRALIKSVENFEDFQAFGRQQVKELNLEKGDVFIAVSEGGETSSVIGSAHEALDRGCTVFFVFNNHKNILINQIKRSRELIQRKELTPIDLTTGPMAVSGSTRMQATTMELLYLGSIMETSITGMLKNTVHDNDVYKFKSIKEYPEIFSKLLKNFNRIENINNIAAIIDLQEKTYAKGKTVLYSAVEFLLDIFTDTTEQTPTFSLPSFRSADSQNTPAPWAAALHPLKNTQETWYEMLGRNPEGLSWDKSLYRKLGTPEIAENPPRLDRKEIYSYKIGIEGFTLYRKEASVLINIFFPSIYKKIYPNPEYTANLEDVYDLNIITCGDSPETRKNNVFNIILPLPSSPLQLFPHVAAKILFNIISTGTMARMGRIRGNWMIEVTPSNKKLIDRSIRIISDLKSVSYKDAAYMVFKEIERHPEDLSSLVARLL